MLTNDDRNAIIKTEMALLPDEVFAWRNAEAVSEDLAAELSEAFDRCTNRRWADRLFAWIGIGSPEDYFEKLLDIGHAKLLCGIRFKGGDATQPFVELVGSTEPIGNLGAAIHIALDAYARFAVTEARVFRTTDPKSPSIHSRGDQILVAAPLHALVVENGSPSVTLTDAPVNEASAFVHEQYDHLALERPDLASLTMRAYTEELTECCDLGKLCWWFFDGERAGLIAVWPNKQRGLNGYEIVEEIVAENFLGRRTAAMAQRKLAAALIADGSDPSLTLHGTIDCRNPASRRAARDVGRRELAAWWFVKSP